jgi:hypothetical protein
MNRDTARDIQKVHVGSQMCPCYGLGVPPPPAALRTWRRDEFSASSVEFAFIHEQVDAALGHVLRSHSLIANANNFVPPLK